MSTETKLREAPQDGAATEQPLLEVVDLFTHFNTLQVSPLLLMGFPSP